MYCLSQSTTHLSTAAEYICSHEQLQVISAVWQAGTSGFAFVRYDCRALSCMCSRQAKRQSRPFQGEVTAAA